MFLAQQIHSWIWSSPRKVVVISFSAAFPPQAVGHMPLLLFLMPALGFLLAGAKDEESLRHRQTHRHAQLMIIWCDVAQERRTRELSSALRLGGDGEWRRCVLWFKGNWEENFSRYNRSKHHRSRIIKSSECQERDSGRASFMTHGALCHVSCWLAKVG